MDWAVILLLAPVALELLRQTLGWRFGVHRLFFLYLADRSAWWIFLVVLTTVLCVATPIKIWNNARIEHRLEEQEKLLLTARVEALASQINPHFLFNTLTSIQSLIRTDPETARSVIVKLSGLLRRLLRSRDHFVTLREELESIDEYLDIEVIRYGPQLKVEKQISPDTLDVHRAEHDPAAARGEFDQAWVLAQGRRRAHHHPKRAPERACHHRSRGRWARNDARNGWALRSPTASA